MAFAKRKITGARTIAPIEVLADLDETDIPEDEHDDDNELSEDEMTELERLRAENARLRAGRALSIQVSEKGAISVYGLGRFPVTLYKDQWLKVFDMVDDIKAFIKANIKLLKVKGQTK